MNTNTQPATLDMTQINSNISVGMDEVVNVFISKYEDSLHDQRKQLQTEMVRINNRIKDLHDEVLGLCKESVTSSNSLQTVDTGILTMEFKLGDLTVVWDKGVVEYVIEVHTKSKTVTDGSYRSNQQCSIICKYAIPMKFVEYNDLMERKTKLTDQLAIVNTNLRDVGRKERKVRGRIAEMKLKNMGLEELLNEPQLLSLISDPLES